ncbi:hypothetical protein DFJ73DRAFT_852615 [Zopfochytrium polystomum]|nr:hypothetical protein DFJ73DRAFT_852615 [Zopfochytrium polystomum]
MEKEPGTGSAESLADERGAGVDHPKKPSPRQLPQVLVSPILREAIVALTALAAFLYVAVTLARLNASYRLHHNHKLHHQKEFVPSRHAEGTAGQEVLHAALNRDEPRSSAVPYTPMPPLRDQADIQDLWVADRVDRILPALLAAHDVSFWLVSQREYGEDPVFWATVPRSKVFSARRRTLMAFHLTDEGLLKKWLFIDNTPKVWDDLKAVLEETKPRNIAINADSTLAFADGMHLGEAEAIIANLPLQYVPRIVRRPLLPIQFLATRPNGMLPFYENLMKIVHSIIAEGFSAKVITPGKTSTADVQWWFRDKIQAMNMTTWFHPSVDLTRPGPSGPINKSGPDAIIQPGDLIWTDFGVTIMGLNTDTQHMGYVLKPDEADPPAGLERGLTHHSNLMQDVVMEEILPGRTGNEVLVAARKKIQELGVNGTVYCHPIGDYGHAAGSLIGMTNLQDGVPVLGDLPIFPNMWYSIELQANVPIPEWGGQHANFRQEEDAYIDEKGDTHWVFRRQDKLHVVRPTYA